MLSFIQQHELANRVQKSEIKFYISTRNYTSICFAKALSRVQFRTNL